MSNITNITVSTFASVTSIVKSEVKAALAATNLFNVEKKVVVGVEKTRVAGKKTKSGYQHTKVKRTPVYQTQTVVDTDALNRMANMVRRHNLELAKQQAKAEQRARAEYKRMMAERVGELSHIDSQISKARELNIRPVHVKEASTEVKIGGPSAGAIRNAIRVERGIAQAKRMVARAIVAKYTRTCAPIITSIAEVPVIVCSARREEDGQADSHNNNNKETNMENKYFSILVAQLGNEQATKLWNEAQDDLGCGVFSSLYDALREHLVLNGINGIDLNAEVSLSNADVRRDTNASADSLDLTNPVVKPGQQTKYEDNNMGYINLIADMIITGSSAASLDMGLSAEDRAKAQAKAEARKDEFVTYFADKLIAPAIDNLFIVKNAAGKQARAKCSGKLANFFNCFNLYGVDVLGNPAEVRFAKQDIAAAPDHQSMLDGVEVTNAYQFWAYTLANATVGLSSLDKARFFALAFKGVGKKFNVTESSVIFHGVEFDFASGQVRTKSQIKEANPSVELYGAEFNAGHAVFLLALTCYGKSDRAVNTIVNNAISLFKRDENYGMKTVDTDLAYGIYHNLQLAVVFGKSVSTKFPFYSIGSGKLADEKLGEVLARGEMAVVDKYNMKWLAKGVAAEAVLLGRDGDIIRNLNDANKPTKFYNRPASNKYSFACVEGRTNTHFVVALSDGNYAYSAGKLVNVAWTNSRYGHGSGVVEINPEFGFNYTVAKSLKTSFNILTIPHAVRVGKTYEEVATAIAESFNVQILSLVGKTFVPGESMLALTLGKSSKTVLTNSNKAVDLRVTGGRAVITSKFEIDIKLDVEIVGVNEQYVKLRGIGKKATTLPYQVDGIDAPWDILLNIEGVKGWPALIEMYCNSFGTDCYYNSNTGILSTPNGDVDFNDVENDFTRWCVAQQQETVITRKMARSCYEDLKATMEPHAAPTLFALQALVGTRRGLDVYVEDNGDHDFVILHERVQYIMGRVAFDVEVATPKESVSSTEFTLEAVNGILLQDKALGEAIMADMVTKVSAADSLVNSFMQVGGLPEFNVLTQTDRDGIKSAFKVAPQSHGGFADHRAMLKDLCKAFPRGFVVKAAARTSEYKFEIHPRALATFGGFTSNGSATREVGQVMDFLYFITDNIGGESGIEAAIIDQCYRTSKTLSSWADNLVTSKSAMKKFTRSGKLVGGKVRTTYSPACNNVNGLPVVVVNPDGPMAQMLKLDRNITFGQIVGLTRTPMPFLTAAYVRLDHECPIGHVLVSPKVWHAANEGDSDGDGIALLNLTKYGVDTARALKINESLMGPSGYEFMYGDALPVYEFSAHKDKWGDKKSLTVWEKPIITAISVDEYAAGATQVSQHYKFNVGTSYAICSQLVFAASNALYANPDSEEYDTIVKACVVAWRGIYEGLGLSGYTLDAKRFFDVLRFTAYSHVDGKIKSVNGELTYGFASTTKDDIVREVNGIEELRKFFPRLSLAVVARIIKSRAICITYRKIESAGVSSISPKSAMKALVPAAIISGALRRLGQGADPVEIVVDMDMADGDTNAPESLFTVYHTNNMSAKLSNPVLAAIAGNGTKLHAIVISELTARAQEELV